MTGIFPVVINSVVITEECNVMVKSEDLIVTTGYMTL